MKFDVWNAVVLSALPEWHDYLAFKARKENTALTTKHNNKKEEEIKQI